jgi:large subunit ribosomal protein L10
MLREKKLEFVEEMKADLDRCQAIVFVDFTGLTVAEADRFRSKMREAEVTYRVVKNTLMKRVIAGTSYEEASQWLKGTPTGVAYSFEDPVAPARVTYEFLKGCDHIKVKGGMLDNRAISIRKQRIFPRCRAALRCRPRFLA